MICYTPTAIMLARYVTHMNTQSPGGICYASLEVYLRNIHLALTLKGLCINKLKGDDEV